jgi:hypothetical protein
MVATDGNKLVQELFHPGLIDPGSITAGDWAAIITEIVKRLPLDYLRGFRTFEEWLGCSAYRIVDAARWNLPYMVTECRGVGKKTVFLYLGCLACELVNAHTLEAQLIFITRKGDFVIAKTSWLRLEEGGPARDFIWWHSLKSVVYQPTDIDNIIKGYPNMSNLITGEELPSGFVIYKGLYGSLCATLDALDFQLKSIVNLRSQMIEVARRLQLPHQLSH